MRPVLRPLTNTSTGPTPSPRSRSATVSRSPAALAGSAAAMPRASGTGAQAPSSCTTQTPATCASGWRAKRARRSPSSASRAAPAPSSPSTAARTAVRREQHAIGAREADPVRLLVAGAVEMHADQFAAAAIGVVEQPARREQHPARAVGMREQRRALVQMRLQPVPAQRAVEQRRHRHRAAGGDADRPGGGRRFDRAQRSAMRVEQTQMRVGAEQHAAVRQHRGAAAELVAVELPAGGRRAAARCCPANRRAAGRAPLAARRRPAPAAGASVRDGQHEAQPPRAAGELDGAAVGRNREVAARRPQIEQRRRRSAPRSARRRRCGPSRGPRRHRPRRRRAAAIRWRIVSCEAGRSVKPPKPKSAQRRTT